MHPGLLASFEMACDKLSDSKLVKKRNAKSALPAGDVRDTKIQRNMEECSTRSIVMTQDKLDNYILVSKPIVLLCKRF
jgi:hypothetical protein